MIIVLCPTKFYVKSDQNCKLVRHMSCQEKIFICSPGLVLMFELGLIYTVFSEEQNPAPPSINSIFRYCIFLLQVNDIINRKFNIFQNNPFCHIFFCIFRTFLFVVVKTRETVFFHAAPTNVTLVIQVPVITLISQFSINFEVNNWQKQGTI